MSHLPFAMFLGGSEIWVILIVALLLFGTRIPAVMRSLGQGVTEFKRGIEDGSDDSKPASPASGTPATSTSASSED